jgi:hypothetical protein
VRALAEFRQVPEGSDSFLALLADLVTNLDKATLPALARFSTLVNYTHLLNVFDYSQDPAIKESIFAFIGLLNLPGSRHVSNICPFPRLNLTISILSGEIQCALTLCHRPDIGFSFLSLLLRGGVIGPVAEYLVSPEFWRRFTPAAVSGAPGSGRALFLLLRAVNDHPRLKQYREFFVDTIAKARLIQEDEMNVNTVFWWKILTFFKGSFPSDFGFVIPFLDAVYRSPPVKPVLEVLTAILEFLALAACPVEILSHLLNFMTIESPPIVISVDKLFLNTTEETFVEFCQTEELFNGLVHGLKEQCDTQPPVCLVHAMRLWVEIVRITAFWDEELLDICKRLLDVSECVRPAKEIAAMIEDRLTKSGEEGLLERFPDDEELERLLEVVTAET